MKVYRQSLNEAHRITLEELTPWIEANAQREDGERFDAAPVFILDRVKQRLQAFFNSRAFNQHVSRIASMVDRNISRDLKKIPGIDPTALLVGGEQTLAAFRERNVNLIKTVSARYLDDIRQTLDRTDVRNLHVRGMRKILQDRFGVNKSRAELWARDQTLKLNSQVTQERHKAAGIQEYIWTTSKDERVRDKHKRLNGKRFRYDDPPVTNDEGDRNNPGEDYQCRCIAYPVLPEPEDEL